MYLYKPKIKYKKIKKLYILKSLQHKFIIKTKIHWSSLSLMFFFNVYIFLIMLAFKLNIPNKIRHRIFRILWRVSCFWIRSSHKEILVVYFYIMIKFIKKKKCNIKRNTISFVNNLSSYYYLDLQNSFIL